MGYSARYTIIIALVGAAAYEAFPLDLSKTGDLRAIVDVDSAPRIVGNHLLPNPYLSTG